jgi:hypothetical protein
MLDAWDLQRFARSARMPVYILVQPASARSGERLVRLVRVVALVTQLPAVLCVTGCIGVVIHLRRNPSCRQSSKAPKTTGRDRIMDRRRRKYHEPMRYNLGVNMILVLWVMLLQAGCASHNTVPPAASSAAPAFHIAVQHGELPPDQIEALHREFQQGESKLCRSLKLEWFRVHPAFERDFFAIAQASRPGDDPAMAFARTRGVIAASRDQHVFFLLRVDPSNSMVDTNGSHYRVQSTKGIVDNLGQRALEMELDKPGGAMMEKLSGHSVGKSIAIVVNGEVCTVPQLMSQVGARLILAGAFTQQEYEDLLARLTPQ